jgi:hypothetical protein
MYSEERRGVTYSARAPTGWKVVAVGFNELGLVVVSAWGAMLVDLREIVIVVCV